MITSIENPKVDFYFTKAQKWKNEICILRTIILQCGLTEDLKWGVPCYTFEKKNIVLIHTFKEYCAVLFFKGALLKDAKHVLIQQTKNVQATRQMRFTKVVEIDEMKSELKAFIKEALVIEKAGLKIDLIKPADFVIPEEFQLRLIKNPTLKNAFEDLTAGRQRAYLLHFAAAKLSATKEVRIEKCIPLILSGKGLKE